MKRSLYSEEQIAFTLNQAEFPTPVPEISRNMGVLDAESYTWLNKYDGLARSELKHLKQLELENHRVKKLVANLSPKKVMPHNVEAKKL